MLATKKCTKTITAILGDGYIISNVKAFYNTGHFQCTTHNHIDESDVIITKIKEPTPQVRCH
jgi:hypothetical protein